MTQLGVSDEIVIQCLPSDSVTLPPNLKLSFGSSLGTHRLPVPAFCMTFPLLVDLKSANPSVFAAAAISLLSVFMQATCLSSRGTELTY